MNQIYQMINFIFDLLISFQKNECNTHTKSRKEKMMKSKIVPIRFKQPDYDYIEKKAIEQGTTISSLIRNALYNTILKPVLEERRRRVISVIQQFAKEKKS